LERDQLQSEKLNIKRKSTFGLSLKIARAQTQNTQ
jgi:hypothetical protein